jgi:hypothetical protein
VIGILRVKIVFRAMIVKIGPRTTNAAAIRIAKIIIATEELELLILISFVKRANLPFVVPPG